MKLNILFVLSVCIISSFSCRKDAIPNLTVPVATQTGQNTLGFLLGSNVWANYGRRCTTLGGCKDNKVTALLYKQNNGNFFFEINAGFTADTIDQLFSIAATNITNAGTIALDSNLNHTVTFYANRNTGSIRIYQNRLAGKCAVTFTKFDTVARIVSGFFYATLYNTTSLNDSIKIESGRFDAQLSYR